MSSFVLDIILHKSNEKTFSESTSVDIFELYLLQFYIFQVKRTYEFDQNLILFVTFSLKSSKSILQQRRPRFHLLKYKIKNYCLTAWI